MHFRPVQTDKSAFFFAMAEFNWGLFKFFDHDCPFMAPAQMSHCHVCKGKKSDIGGNGGGKIPFFRGF